MRIGFISSDWSRDRLDEGGMPPLPGGAGWYRARIPAWALSTLGGHEVVHTGNLGVWKPTGEILPISWQGEPFGGCDVVVLQRWMGEDAPDVIRKARSTGQIVVNDVDDWYKGLDPNNQAFVGSHPKSNPTVNRNHFHKALAASSAITVSTPFLLEKYGTLGPPTYLISNAIDLWRWERQEVRDTDRPTIGWVGATPWRSGDLEILKGIIGPFIEANGLRFIHGGHTDSGREAAALLGINPDFVEKRPMVPITAYPMLFEGIDIGIVPLRDVGFNHAKSAVKGMEYAASGVPYIASTTPAYGEFHAGCLARRPRDWQRFFGDLMDPAVRAQFAELGFQRVQFEDIRRRWQEWETVYSELIGTRPPETKLTRFDVDIAPGTGTELPDEEQKSSPV